MKQGNGVAHAWLVLAVVIPLSLSMASFSFPAVAQSTDADGPAGGNPTLEEVVVTAQRREERLMDVPLAVTALSGEELDRLGALDLLYLSQTTPNTTIEVARGTNNALAAYIRGVGQQDHIAGFESGVGLYVDDVYFNRPQAGVLEIYDVERIEVLRGPQGTLYGRNTVGGAIKYVTRRLGAEPELKLLGRVGNYAMLDAIATFTLPLAGALRVGGSFASFNQDGFGDNLYLPGMENYEKRVNAARFSIEWTPGEDLFIRLAADWLEDTSDLRRGHRLMPGAYSGALVLKNVFDTRAGSAVPDANAEARGVSLLTEWTVTDTVIVRGIFASRSDDTWKPVDLDSLPTVDVDPATWDGNEQKTAELQVVFGDGRWSGVAGLFGLDASAATRLEVQLGTTGAIIGRPGLNNLLHSEVDTRSWALFADLAYALSDRWSVSLGGRYTHDRRKAQITRQILVNGLSDFFGGSGVLVRTDSNFNGSEVFEKFTPRATIQWLSGDGQNLYLGYSEGFKGGGFDPRGLTTLTPDFDGDGQVSVAEIHAFMRFDPEEVRSWELGWKSVLLDGRMTSRLAVFRSRYTDVQIPGSVSVDANGDGIAEQYVGITSNAADATIEGLEWEGQTIVAEELGFPGAVLQLSWALGLIDAEFNKFIDASGHDVAAASRFANTPKWNAAAGADYSFPMSWFGRRGTLAIITTVSMRGDEVQFYTPDPLIDQQAYALWDMSLVWTGADGRWQLGLYGQNLTDKAYKVTGLNITLGLEDNVTAYYGNPRQYWMAMQYRFQ